MYKRGMTVLEAKSSPTARNHHIGSAGRKQLGAHLPAQNHSWRLVNEWALEDITHRVDKCTRRRVKKQNNAVDTHTSDSKNTW